MKAIESSRFDTRLPKEQKDLFEYAASLGGFRTLTEFVMFSAREHAKKIIEDHNKVLASNKDQKIFFNAMVNPKKPNSNLKNAALNYKKLFGA
ncbi:MAG: DUF1778 domain-containing protein [Flavobacteriales bacterium]|nr:DUF1778 domain-containing protein [Flavobacteriales bacterium]